MSRTLERYCIKLADRLQETWEESVRIDFSQQLAAADNEDLRGNLQMHLDYMRQGVYNYGRHYRVVDKDDRWAIVYDCNVTGMPMVHCIVSKETGDVARRCIKLVKEAFFPFNLMDFASRIDCMAQANYNGDYLG